MRKRTNRKLICAVAVFAVLLCGCDPAENIRQIAGNSFPESADPLGSEYQQMPGDAETENRKAGENAIEAACQTAVESVSTDHYVYTTLDGETQRVYDEIYQTMQEHKESVRVDTLDADVLAEAYKAVSADYGGIFWVSGYVYTQYTRGEELIGLDFSPNYTMSREERETVQAKIDAKVAEIISGISAQASDYEKVRYVYDYLASNIAYEEEASDNQNIISVFLNGRTVCQGYACATQYLLDLLGIQSAVVTGEANGASHAWNLVRMDGEYYYVDTTWGNSTYTLDKEGETRFVNYNYFGVTTEEISVTHTPNDYFVLPDCTANADNYYVKENRYFSEWNPDAIGALCAEGYETGSVAVSVKFAAPELLEKACQYFIDEQHIADYCAGISSLYYVEDEQQNVFIFRFL